MGGGGESRVLAGGSVFERAGVSFSHVRGDKLPPPRRTCARKSPARLSRRWACRWCFIRAIPYAPTTHCNVRFLIATPEGRPRRMVVRRRIRSHALLSVR